MRYALAVALALTLSLHSAWGVASKAPASGASTNKMPGASATARKERPATRTAAIDEILNGVKTLENPSTHIAPSHWGHPGYEKIAWTYDIMSQVLAFKAAGRQDDAEAMLDYFVDKLEWMSTKEMVKRADSNDSYGMIKLFRKMGDSSDATRGFANRLDSTNDFCSLVELVQKPGGSNDVARGFANAIDITSRSRKGQGMMEYSTSPGPMAFAILAMLQTNPGKYRAAALEIGNLLLDMQDAQGGIHDGDREPKKIHTEPHMDTFDAFLMLYDVTGDEKWRRAANKAYDWFAKNVFVPADSLIYQGVWEDGPHRVLSEDVFAWVMCGPAGDRWPLDTLKRITDYWLNHYLARITVPLPDGSVRVLTLMDFCDSGDPACDKARHGHHPMGSIEWTSGAILSLQKNAVRFFKAGDEETARIYKGLAEMLTDNVLNSFYYVPKDTNEVYISFYATGQGITVGPFGSSKRGSEAGWFTPYWHATPANGPPVMGGSTISSWIALPVCGLNPFVRNDSYKMAYNDIPMNDRDIQNAKDFVNKVVTNRTYVESVPKSVPDGRMQIRDTAAFLEHMWKAMDAAKAAVNLHKMDEAQTDYKEVVRWASVLVSDTNWIRLARRDNQLKEKEVGGLVLYHWGKTFADNDDVTHAAILRYPLLNDMAAAMYGLAVANMELGNPAESKKWIKRIMVELPLHQIPATMHKANYGYDDPIVGYWNCVDAWERLKSCQTVDKKMSPLYIEVLAELGVSSANLKIVDLNLQGADESLMASAAKKDAEIVGDDGVSSKE